MTLPMLFMIFSLSQRWLVNAPIAIAAFFAVAQFVAADELAADKLVAEAGKAFETLTPPRGNSPRAMLTSIKWHDGWIKLAQARANLGDTAGAIEAINKVNTDPDASLCSVQVMQAEATGVIPPEPQGISAKSLAIRRQGIINVLIGLAEYKKAIDEARLLPDPATKALSITRAYLAIAKTQRLEERYEAALRSYRDAILTAGKIQSADDAFDCQNEICRGLIGCGFELGAAVVLKKVEGFLDEAAVKESLDPGVLAQEWLRVGRFWIVMQDEALAGKAFAKAEKLYTRYGQARTGIDWSKSSMRLGKLAQQCQAYVESKQLDKARKTLKEWEPLLGDSADSERFVQRCSSLADNQLLAGQDDSALKSLRRISDSPKKLLALSRVKETVTEFGDKTHAEFFASFAREEFRDEKEIDLRIPALALAAEAYRDGSQRAKLIECVDEELKLSRQAGKGHHDGLAAFLAESRLFDRARQVMAEIDDPADRAYPLAELANQFTREMCEKKLAPAIQARKDLSPKTKLVRIPKQ